ncbi:MAG: glycoside hydrolase family 3 N-terminal domain-containing protein, partial [Bacteroidota bacterium]
MPLFHACDEECGVAFKRLSGPTIFVNRRHFTLEFRNVILPPIQSPTMKGPSFLLLVFFLSNISCQQTTPHDTDQTASQPTLAQKIGQMIMVGFREDRADAGTKIHELVDQYHIGGVVLYNRDVPSRDSLSRNIHSKEQLTALNTQLQAISPTKLLIAIDEEGGKVSRLSAKNGFQQHASHLRMGELNQLDSTRLWAQQMATELQELGINMNFAPVVDLNINPECPVIGKIERSFSADPDLVTAHSKLFIEAHRKRNIVCVPKHFPGHGSAQMDSHQGFTDVSQTWQETELLPYQKLIEANYCDIIMTAHVYNDQLDSLPSTLSAKIIKTVLKERF